jgi:hypothetical protein
MRQASCLILSQPVPHQAGVEGVCTCSFVFICVPFFFFVKTSLLTGKILHFVAFKPDKTQEATQSLSGFLRPDGSELIRHNYLTTELLQASKISYHQMTH